MPRNKSLADSEYRVIHSNCGTVSSIDFNETKKTIEAHLILGCASINLFIVFIRNDSEVILSHHVVVLRRFSKPGGFVIPFQVDDFKRFCERSVIFF